MNFDRFASVAITDPQDMTLDFISHCGCGCGVAIHFRDEDVLRYDGDYFASADCVARAVGAERMDYQWG